MKGNYGGPPSSVVKNIFQGGKFCEILLQAKGEEEGWKLFNGIGDNAPYFSKRGKEPSQKTIAGEVVYPEDGIPWVPACMAIFANNDNVEGSKAFVDWILSQKGQEFIRDTNGSIMVRPDVAMPEALKDVPSERYLKILMVGTALP